MKINVFIYSNIHLIIACALINDRVKNTSETLNINLHISNLIFENISFIINSGFYDFLLKRKNINVNLTAFSTPFPESNIFEKICGLIYNFFSFKNYKSDIVMIPNFSNLYVLLCLFRIRFKRLIYIDEGMSYISFKRILKHNQKSRSYFLTSLFSKYASPYTLPVNKSIKAYVFNKEKFYQIKDFSKFNLNLLELKNVFSNFVEDLNNNKYKNENYTFVVTSPLSDRKYTSYSNEEFDILYKFLKSYIISNPSRKIIIKVHYKENLSKYNDLLKLSKLVSIYEGYLSFQELLISYPKSDIICFHSSAVFSMQNLNLIKNIYCLCDLIKTPSMKTISNAIKEISSDYVIFVK